MTDKKQEQMQKQNEQACKGELTDEQLDQVAGGVDPKEEVTFTYGGLQVPYIQQKPLGGL
jgi:hypothetical protein